jgi:hypothetical protein
MPLPYRIGPPTEAQVLAAAPQIGSAPLPEITDFSARPSRFRVYRGDDGDTNAGVTWGAAGAVVALQKKETAQGNGFARPVGIGVQHDSEDFDHVIELTTFTDITQANLGAGAYWLGRLCHCEGPRTAELGTWAQVGLTFDRNSNAWSVGGEYKEIGDINATANGGHALAGAPVGVKLRAVNAAGILTFYSDDDQGAGYTGWTQVGTSWDQHKWQTAGTMSPALGVRETAFWAGLVGADGTAVASCRLDAWTPSGVA